MGTNAERYLTQVERALTCPPGEKAALLKRGRELVEAFLEETPAAGYAQLTDAFGPPNAFAGEMLEQLDPALVEHTQKQGVLRKRAVMAAVAIALVLCSLFWFLKWKKAQEIVRGEFWIRETITYMTDEEVREAIDRIQSEDPSQKGG